VRRAVQISPGGSGLGCGASAAFSKAASRVLRRQPAIAPRHPQQFGDTVPFLVREARSYKV